MKKLLMIILCLAMILPCFAGCNEQKSDVFGEDMTKYTIILAASAGNEVKQQAQALSNLINEHTGVKVPVKTDAEVSADSSSKEILLGQTNRSESAEVLENAGTNGYAVKFTGNKLVIVGTSDRNNADGVQWFVQNGLIGKGTNKGIQMDINKQFFAFDRNKIALKASTYVPNASAENLAEWNARVSTWKNASTDNYVYIDVWNWDPDWKVEVWEGDTKLEVTKVVDYNPLHLIAHSANRLNGAGKPNFLTNKGCVMHRVKAKKENTTLSIKVTDRFGNVYTEEMKRPREFNVATYKAY